MLRCECLRFSQSPWMYRDCPPPFIILDPISSGSLANALQKDLFVDDVFWSAKRSQGCRFWSHWLIFLTPFSFRHACAPGCTLFCSSSRLRGHEAASCLYCDALKVKWSEIWYFYVPINCPPRAVSLPEVRSPSWVKPLILSLTRSLALCVASISVGAVVCMSFFIFIFFCLSKQRLISAPSSNLFALQASSLSSTESCFDDAFAGFLVLWCCCFVEEEILHQNSIVRLSC